MVARPEVGAFRLSWRERLLAWIKRGFMPAQPLPIRVICIARPIPKALFPLYCRQLLRRRLDP